jgi:hypothetical protein
MEPLSFLLAHELTRDATLGSRATDPTVPAPEERRRRLPRLPHLSFRRQSGVRSAASFAFSSGGIDSEQALRTNWRSVSSNR